MTRQSFAWAPARGQAVLRALESAARVLTTPFLPEDYLELFDPLWSLEEPRGRIEAVIPETADAATLVIRPSRGWRPHRPGQWVRIGVEIRGKYHWRTFSISSPPERADGRITITVKAIAGGLVSNHLVRRAAPGTIVRLSRPEGEFVLPDPLPPRLLFLTAGSGITPVMAMLSSLFARSTVDGGPTGPDVVLVHSAPTREDVIFGERLRRLAGRSPGLRLVERHTRVEGRLSLRDLAGICPDWTERDVWACGPPAMLDELAAYWPGPADRLHMERFRLAVAPVTGAGGTVRFTASGREATADGRTPLLAVGEAAGVLMPSGCRMGICHGCVVRLRSGRVLDLRTGVVHGEEGDLIQTCVSAAAGPVEIEI